MSKEFIHRFLPNSAPETKQMMLDTIGVKDIEEIYAEIPENCRFRGKLDIPQEPVSEFEVARYLKKVLGKDVGTDKMTSYLGAGCWNHYVPAVCDVINNRAEFVTGYSGSEYVDVGRQQGLFEAASMLAELLDMDVVGAPVYDGYSACGDAMLMAYRKTGRNEVLVPSTMSRDKFDTISLYSSGWFKVIKVACDSKSGQMDLEDLKAKAGENTAAVLIENPTYLGFFEENGQAISDIAHSVGALFIVSAEPISLAVVTPPGQYGADIAVLDGQPLGMHQNCGGGQVGFIACQNTAEMINLMPCWLYGVTETSVEGELAYSWHALYDRMFYVIRDEAKSFTGTSAGLWGITTGVYMSLLGTYGMEKVCETILYNGNYARKLLAAIQGVRVDRFTSAPFQEFVVDFNGTGKTVSEINKALLAKGIIGGKDLSEEFEELGQSALYCVTEIHTKEELDELAAALTEVLS